MRTITCNNNNGMEMTFSSFGFTPFILQTVDGLYKTDNNVVITDNTMIDGGTYQSTIAKVRNIVITLLDQPTNFYNRENREALYVLFAKGQKGTLTYNEDGNEKTIDYYVESVVRETKKTCPITISLLCPDPFFYDAEEHIVDLASWVGDFEFEHDFVADGEELGHRLVVESQDIENVTSADGIGLEITVRANGAVTNPSITKVETGEALQVGSSVRPLSLGAGDVLVITTGTGNKHVYLVQNGTRQEVNGYLTEDSKFIQLNRGSNTIGYGADSGRDNMEVSVKYRYKYEGA